MKVSFFLLANFSEIFFVFHAFVLICSYSSLHFSVHFMSFVLI